MPLRITLVALLVALVAVGLVATGVRRDVPAQRVPARAAGRRAARRRCAAPSTIRGSSTRACSRAVPVRRRARLYVACLAARTATSRWSLCRARDGRRRPARSSTATTATTGLRERPATVSVRGRPDRLAGGDRRPARRLHARSSAPTWSRDEAAIGRLVAHRGGRRADRAGRARRRRVRAGAQQPAAAGRGRAHGAGDRRRRPVPARARGRRPDRGRPAVDGAQRDARPDRERLPRPAGLRGAGPRLGGPDAPLRRRRQPRAAHPADLDPRVRRALPAGRRPLRGGRPPADGADRGRGRPDGPARRGPAAARPAGPAAAAHLRARSTSPRSPATPSTTRKAVQPDRPIALHLDESLTDVPVVLGDEGRLRQVVGNLVTNALTHTPPAPG